MKAVKNFEVSNESQVGKTAGLNDVITHGTKPNDTLFARLRRLEQRMTNIESQASTLRRDVNRVEKRQQRETERPSNETIENQKDMVIPRQYAGLFG